MGVALVAGVAVFALWPRGPRLVWYTSPPMTWNNQTARLKLLVPDGWVSEQPMYITWEEHVPGPDGPYLSIVIRPTQSGRMHFAWLPPTLRKLLFGQPEFSARVDLMFGMNINDGTISAGKVGLPPK